MYILCASVPAVTLALQLTSEVLEKKTSLLQHGLTNVADPTHCGSDEYQSDVLILGCGGGSGTIDIGLQSGETEKIVDIPSGLHDIDIKLEADADLDLRLFDAAQPNQCIYGYGCTNAREIVNDYEGLTIAFSGDDTRAPVIEYINVTGVTHKAFVLFVKAYANTVGTVSWRYGTMDSCPDPKPGCSLCSSYDLCPSPQIPRCDGTAAVACHHAPLISGDPHVWFNGSRTTMHLPTDRFILLLEQGDIAIFAKGGPENVTLMNYIYDVIVKVRGDTAMSVHQELGDLDQKDALLKLTMDDIKCNDLRFERKRDRVQIFHVPTGLNVTVASRRTLRKDAVNSHHLNLRVGDGLVTSGVGSATGALPEIWGTQPLSSEVRSLIVDRSWMAGSAENKVLVADAGDEDEALHPAMNASMLSRESAVGCPIPGHIDSTADPCKKYVASCYKDHNETCNYVFDECLQRKCEEDMHPDCCSSAGSL